jgi:acyl carrier protein
MSEGFEKRVCDVVATALGEETGSLGMDASQDSVDSWDSAGIINVMMALESEFGVSFSADESADLLSMQLVVAMLREKGAR